MDIKLARKKLQVDSIVDGDGLRAVLWTQGCSHNCKGCHNPKTHDFNAGYSVSLDNIKKQIEALECQDGITFSGGDPFFQPLQCSELAKFAHSQNLNVWCYTGFTFEKLLLLSKINNNIMLLLNEIDVLIDGPFILEQRSLNLRYRGSSNQRIIDVKLSLLAGEVVLIDKYNLNKSSNMMYQKQEYMYA